MRRIKKTAEDVRIAAEELMDGILEGDLTLITAACPEELSERWVKEPDVLREKVLRLRGEWIGLAGSEELAREVRTVDVRPDTADEDRCSVYFEFGRPFEYGRREWPVTVEMQYADGTWRVSDEWFRQYILDEDGEC